MEALREKIRNRREKLIRYLGELGFSPAVKQNIANMVQEMYETLCLPKQQLIDSIVFLLQKTNIRTELIDSMYIHIEKCMGENTEECKEVIETIFNYWIYKGLSQEEALAKTLSEFSVKFLRAFLIRLRRHEIVNYANASIKALYDRYPALKSVLKKNAKSEDLGFKVVMDQSSSKSWPTFLIKGSLMYETEEEDPSVFIDMSEYLTKAGLKRYQTCLVNNGTISNEDDEYSLPISIDDDPVFERRRKLRKRIMEFQEHQAVKRMRLRDD